MMDLQNYSLLIDCSESVTRTHRDQVKRFTGQVEQFQCLNLLIPT